KTPHGTPVFEPANRLKPAAPVLRPALDHDLRLRVELDAVPRLRVQIAEEAFAPPAEREERHRRRDTDVDPDIPGDGFAPKAPRRFAVPRENARHIAVSAIVHQPDRFVDRV